MFMIAILNYYLTIQKLSLGENCWDKLKVLHKQIKVQKKNVSDKFDPHTPNLVCHPCLSGHNMQVMR